MSLAILQPCLFELIAMHPGHEHHELERSQWATWWTPAPLVWLALAAALLLYGRGLSVLWLRAGVGHGIGRWEATAFVTGILVLLIALVSPLDRASDFSFAAHMTQHELLLVLAPPLFVLGKSLFGFYWGMPRRLRDLVGGLLRDEPYAYGLEVAHRPVSGVAGARRGGVGLAYSGAVRSDVAR